MPFFVNLSMINVSFTGEGKICKHRVAKSSCYISNSIELVGVGILVWGSS